MASEAKIPKVPVELMAQICDHFTGVLDIHLDTSETCSTIFYNEFCAQQASLALSLCFASVCKLWRDAALMQIKTVTIAIGKQGSLERASILLPLLEYEALNWMVAVDQGQATSGCWLTFVSLMQRYAPKIGTLRVQYVPRAFRTLPLLPQGGKFLSLVRNVLRFVTGPNFYPPLSPTTYPNLKVLHVFLGLRAQDWMLDPILRECPHLEQVYLRHRPYLDPQHPTHRSIHLLDIADWDLHPPKTGVDSNHLSAFVRTMGILTNLTTLTIHGFPPIPVKPEPRLDLPVLENLTVIEITPLNGYRPLWSTFRAPRLGSLTIGSSGYDQEDSRVARNVIGTVSEFISVSKCRNVHSICVHSRVLFPDDVDTFADTLSSLPALHLLSLCLPITSCIWISRILYGPVSDLCVDLVHCQQDVPEGLEQLVRATRLAPGKSVSIVVSSGAVEETLAKIVDEEEGWTVGPDPASSRRRFYKHSG